MRHPMADILLVSILGWHHACLCKQLWSCADRNNAPAQEASSTAAEAQAVHLAQGTALDQPRAQPLKAAQATGMSVLQLQAS